ncbi:hypothetical protein [Tuwongella immobilis]|uniref:Uncharacterized protein n=1 Tax=Tuwongella immobilis TaxID=692036 RepID=A0A6C2YHM2_9BACT|nr:hypothetical protein [Tuwongella immobilis]VIP00917.1 unnamed protein product [Tuwongella immobilis]VTR97252.1 unnamed protein product [Tuwongella immobilis]
MSAQALHSALISTSMIFSGMLLLAGSGHAAAPESLLDLAIRSHVATRDAITSCQCKYRWETLASETANAPPAATGSYLRQGEMQRIEVRAENTVSHCIWTPGTAVRFETEAEPVASTKERPRAYRLEQSPSPSEHLRDPWIHGLLVFPLPELAGHLPLEAYLAKAHHSTARRATDETGDVIVISAEFPTRSTRMTGTNPFRVTITLAAKYGYLATRMQIQFDVPAKTVRSDFRVKSFVNQNGILFPDRTESSIDWNGNMRRTEACEVSEIVLNRPIPADAFQVQYTQPAVLFNSVTQTTYRVDATGKPINELEALGQPINANHIPNVTWTYSNPADKMIPNLTWTYEAPFEDLTPIPTAPTNSAVKWTLLCALMLISLLIVLSGTRRIAARG